ncbi:putative Protein CASP [Hypsibius exemplaris]|uniref:CASP C-terminal domain-containing protein n=1 Tax=Hypsibius exemplaris TaxID=2072580 RepID=A0A1W0WQU3_HYPEX|nr:putative Protein CASP [Hypsibius exemplaris]
MSSSALGVKDTLSGLSLTEPDFVTDALRSESAHSPLHFPPQHSLSFDGAAEASTRDVRLGASYLPILERQHERFHSKIKELEQTNHEIQSRSIALKTEMDAVKVDNVRLYERIRFLQSYEGRKSAGDHRGGGSVSVSLPGATNTSTDAESRYSSAYEANLDPFSSFHRAEKQRKYDALNPVDKATLAMGNMVLGSPISRKAFFIYALLLHLLIFAVVYKMAWSESSIRDFSYDCSSRFADHMKNVHGGNDDHVHNH